MELPWSFAALAHSAQVLSPVRKYADAPVLNGNVDVAVTIDFQHAYPVKLEFLRTMIYTNTESLLKGEDRCIRMPGSFSAS
jgi:hypothetical protein